NLRNVIGAICAILPKLLRECLEALARIPQPEPEESGVEFPEPAPQPMAMPPAPPFIAPATAQAKPFVLPPLPVPAQPAPVPAFLKPTPPAPPPVPVPSIPAPPVAITPAPPLPAPSVPPPVAPAPPAPPAPSIPPPIAPAPPVAATAPVVSAAAPQAEATGLALSGKDAAATAAPPSATQPIEEEALHALQQFFNDNSPDGPLLKSQEDEFIRMAVKLVAIVVPGVTFAQTDFSLRIRQLKDTFVLRKKLRNRLTLTEFKAYFRKTR
ncbi:MAG: hypothetical protein MUF51_06535, partial [Vicinamibacteria bacterium]|nr:hypothetical protein [Vicinamibacteria bacterium]